ncbi:MAG: hypothetical protein ACREUR_11205 [Nitrosospira sp.]
MSCYGKLIRYYDLLIVSGMNGDAHVCQWLRIELSSNGRYGRMRFAVPAAESLAL